jgi:hypothetical protein
VLRIGIVRLRHLTTHYGEIAFRATFEFRHAGLHGEQARNATRPPGRARGTNVGSSAYAFIGAEGFDNGPAPRLFDAPTRHT